MTSEPEEGMVQQLAGLNPVIHAPARLAITAYLSLVESADYLLLLRLTGFTWGNLATHLGKLDEAGYVRIEKEFRNRKPASVVSLTDEGHKAFRAYKGRLSQILNSLPD